MQCMYELYTVKAYSELELMVYTACIAQPIYIKAIEMGDLNFLIECWNFAYGFKIWCMHACLCLAACGLFKVCWSSVVHVIIQRLDKKKKVLLFLCLNQLPVHLSVLIMLSHYPAFKNSQAICSA